MILVEVIGHSGVGKTTLALGITSYLKSVGIEAIFLQESIKEKIFKGEGVDPNQCRVEDTRRIQECLKYEYVDVVVTDTNGMSGYVFGDLNLEDSLEEAERRWDGFSKVIRINLVVESTDFKIKESGRYENSIQEDIVERSLEVRELLHDDNTITLVIDKHIDFSDIRNISSYLVNRKIYKG